MALQDVKANAAGAKHKARWATRFEAKTAAKKLRRRADKNEEQGKEG